MVFVTAKLSPRWWCADYLAELMLGSDMVCEEDKKAARGYLALEKQYLKIDGITASKGQELREQFYQNRLLPKAQEIKKRFKKYVSNS